MILTHYGINSIRGGAAPVDPFADYEDMSLADMTIDYTNRGSVPDSKNLSLFVVVPGVAGKVISAFDVFTSQNNADQVYKQDECVAVVFDDFDFLGHDASFMPGPVQSRPPHYARSWTTSVYNSSIPTIYKQHIVLDDPITMEAGKQYGFIVTTRGNVDNTRCACTNKVSGQNLMLTSTEWYNSGTDEITFSWYESNKFCFNFGGYSPTIIFE